MLERGVFDQGHRPRRPLSSSLTLTLKLTLTLTLTLKCLVWDL